MPGSRYAPEFGVGVAVAKYADHLPLERQVRMMGREGLTVESQTSSPRGACDQCRRNALADHGIDHTGEVHGLGRAVADGVLLPDLAGQIGR